MCVGGVGGGMVNGFLLQEVGPMGVGGVSPLKNQTKNNKSGPSLLVMGGH